MLVIVAALGCLALGWWQWQRFESSGGTGQNLGYAFQWPLFAGFVVYAYRRFVQLEDGDEIENLRADGSPTEIPDGVLPPRPAPEHISSIADDAESRELLDYNTYLAELHRENDRSTS